MPTHAAVATLRIPPKDAFQFLCWVDGIPEVDVAVRDIDADDGAFTIGYEWAERRGRLLRRIDHWRVTAYDKKQRTWIATRVDGEATLALAVKKGGRMSSNIHWSVNGPARVIRDYGHRMSLYKDELDADLDGRSWHPDARAPT